MNNKYTHYQNVAKKILDSVKVGNLIKINDCKRPMKVVGVSDNYFVMIQKVCGNICYSVCEKKSWDGIRYNAMRGGMYHCGTDNTVFGYGEFDYKFDDEKEIEKYLNGFEIGEIELSVRTAIPIYDLYIK